MVSISIFHLVYLFNRDHAQHKCCARVGYIGNLHM